MCSAKATRKIEERKMLGILKTGQIRIQISPKFSTTSRWKKAERKLQQKYEAASLHRFNNLLPHFYRSPGFIRFLSCSYSRHRLQHPLSQCNIILLRFKHKMDKLCGIYYNSSTMDLEILCWNSLHILHSWRSHGPVNQKDFVNYFSIFCLVCKYHFQIVISVGYSLNQTFMKSMFLLFCFQIESHEQVRIRPLEVEE